MEEAEMDSVHSPIYILCLQKSEEMNPRSSVRHKKCVLAFIPLPMSSRNEVKYYLGRLVFLFPLLVMTDRKTDCRYLSSKASHWDAYANDEVEAVCFIFPSLLCIIKYKWSHNLLALSSLKFYPATAPGSHQNHNNSICFPFWKETLFLTSRSWPWLLILKTKHTCTQNCILQWANIALIQIILYLWVELHYIYEKEGFLCLFLFLNHILKRSYVKHSCEKFFFFSFFISLPPHLFL